jgi:spore germination cell wall hydrolase CwlJ-like protein
MKKLMGLAALVLSTTLITGVVNAETDTEHTGTVDQSLHAPEGIAAGLSSSYTTPDSSYKEPEGTSTPEGIPVVPFDDSVAETVTEEASGVLSDEADTETEEKLSFFDRVWHYLSAEDDSIVAKGKILIHKMETKSTFGESAVSPPNYAVILEAQHAMEQAESVRVQREIAMRVKADEEQRLYDESLLCLALNGFHEARGETADQEVATAAVVLNRLSVGFRGATTVCEVIYTPKQFSWVEQHGVHIPDTSKKLERQAWERSLLIAKRMLDPDATFIDPSNGALYYYNPSIVDWKYKNAYTQVAVLGSHRFMTEKVVNHPHHINNRQVRINPVLFNGLSHGERKELIAEFQTEKVGE